MTNFFEHQAKARRRTGLLVAYFIAAIVALVALTYLLVAGVFIVPQAEDDLTGALWQPGLLAGVTAAVLALVSPEAAQGFPEIEGFTIFRILLSPRSLKAAADTPEAK